MFTIVHKYTIILYASICAVDAVEGSSETGGKCRGGCDERRRTLRGVISLGRESYIGGWYEPLLVGARTNIAGHVKQYRSALRPI